MRGDVRFFDVDFGYNRMNHPARHHTVRRKRRSEGRVRRCNQRGQATITNLINRFYDLADGRSATTASISIDQKADLRRSLGIVLQDTNLFTGTIRDNIATVVDATDRKSWLRRSLPMRTTSSADAAGQLRYRHRR